MNPNVDEDPVSPLASTSSSASTNFVSLCDYELSSSDEEKEEVNMTTLDQCFSISGPRPSGGPWSSFGGPQGFPHFIENKTFRHNFHTNV